MRWRRGRYSHSPRHAVCFLPADVLARILATILLLVSLSMLVPLGIAVVHLARGVPVLGVRWLLPLAIIAIAAALMGLLSRKQIPLELFLVAVALWLLTAGYFWIQVGI